MRKLFSALLVLTLVCGFSGLALAEESESAVELEDLLAPASESCLGPVEDSTADTADNQLADLEAELLQPMMGGEPCNETTCAPNEFCCNFSCSICAPRGGFCIQTICE